MSKSTVSHALLVLAVTQFPPGLLHPLQLHPATRALARSRNGYQGSLWQEMIPIPNKSAKTVASALIRNVFCRRDIPESILTDRGCEFDNQAISTIAHELGIDKKRISALHPQANGIVERLNRTIGEMLRETTDNVVIAGI